MAQDYYDSELFAARLSALYEHLYELYQLNNAFATTPSYIFELPLHEIADTHEIFPYYFDNMPYLVLSVFLYALPDMPFRVQHAVDAIALLALDCISYILISVHF